MATDIKGIEGLAPGELAHQIELGGRFVFYKYTISVVVMTFRRPSAIYFVPPGSSRVTRGLVYSLVTLLLGWWGIPWGPIYSIGSLWGNFAGGTDVTWQVKESMGLAVSAGKLSSAPPAKPLWKQG